MKNSTLITAFMLIYSLTAFCQEPVSTATVEVKKLQIGVNISPDYCDRILINSSGNEDLASTIELFNDMETGKFSFTSGLNLNYKVNRKFGLETGIQYSNKGFAFRMDDLFFGDQIDPRYGFVYDSISGPIPSSIKYRYSFHYIDIPIKVFVTLGEKRLKFVTGIGITTNILLKATQTYISEFENGDKERDTRKQPNDPNPINFSGTASAGVAYNLSNALEMRIEPTFRYGLLKLFDSEIASHLWNGGLNISCYYTL